MEKKSSLQGILAIVGLLVLFVSGYSAVKLFIIAPVPERAASALIDHKTGRSLSLVEVNAIVEQQERESVTHTLIGEVTVKLRDSVQVEITVKGKTHLVQVRFAPKIVFLKNMPISGSSATEEKEITLDEVNVGDTVTMTFPQGLLLSEISETKAVTVNNLVVDAPHSPSFAED
ncbi:MAG: hypothetical protein HYT94_01525 [Parcubacteria group bacterium]|nr:hypothetical protein [Parcubacteria group bacterium]